MTAQIVRATPIQLIRQQEKEVSAKETDWRKAKEIADYLGVSLPTVSRWTNQAIDPLPSRRLRGVLQYDFEKVKEWEKRNTEER